MEKIMLFQNNIVNEENMLFHLEYSLLIRSAEWGKSYGVEIVKSDARGIVESEFTEGISEDREQLELFLARLAKGVALPEELTALCDDYIGEKEQLKWQEPVQAVS